MDAITRSGPPAEALPPRQRMIGLLPDMRAFARFLVKNRGEADDLVQDALVRALGALDQFDADTNLKAWLFTILRNIFFEQTRRRRTERAVLDRAASGREEAVEDGHDRRAALSDLERRLWQLPPLLREAVVLVGAQELTYDEAAVVCGVPAGTVKARVSRARSQLRKLVDHDPPARADDVAGV